MRKPGSSGPTFGSVEASRGRCNPGVGWPSAALGRMRTFCYARDHPSPRSENAGENEESVHNDHGYKKVVDKDEEMNEVMVDQGEMNNEPMRASTTDTDRAKGSAVGPGDSSDLDREHPMRELDRITMMRVM